jgi:catechol 2,3-dioxygenase
MATSATSRATESIAAATRLGVMALTVADLERSVGFYEAAIGLRTLTRVGSTAALGVEDGRPLLTVTEQPGAHPPTRPHTGLYHVALLLPSRVDLGHAILRLSQADWPLVGGADHAVSEAIYLDDPDGNGLEIYRDRPRDEWARGEHGLHIVTERLDVEGILRDTSQADSPPATMPTGTRVGHLHLQVGDIAEARRFYHEILGFDVVWDLPQAGALFVSAGGYHHHLGLNTWQSRNAPPPPPDSTGLRFGEVVLPDATARERVAARLADAGIPATPDGNALVVRDPWGNALALSTGGGLPPESALTLAAKTRAT